MIEVMRFEIENNYVLICELSNQVTYRFDMSRIISTEATMVKPLKDENFFKKVYLVHGQLTWPNGYDIHAETIELEGTPLTQVAS